MKRRKFIFILIILLSMNILAKNNYLSLSSGFPNLIGLNYEYQIKNFSIGISPGVIYGLILKKYGIGDWVFLPRICGGFKYYENKKLYLKVKSDITYYYGLARGWSINNNKKEYFRYDAIFFGTGPSVGVQNDNIFSELYCGIFVLYFQNKDNKKFKFEKILPFGYIKFGFRF